MSTWFIGYTEPTNNINITSTWTAHSPVVLGSVFDQWTMRASPVTQCNHNTSNRSRTAAHACWLSRAGSGGGGTLAL